MCLVVFMQLFNVSGRQEMVSEIKCYLRTAIEHPTYLVMLTLVDGIAVQVFI